MKITLGIVAEFLTGFSLVNCFIDYLPLIEIPSGKLLGDRGKSSAVQRDFFKFYCIPYAKAERFEPSRPAEPWEGVRDATFCSIHCPQTAIAEMADVFMSVHEDEDCLILNVFMPAKLKRKRMLPVMVWIHGGYFAQGSSLEYSGEIFLNEEIVMVTINYRLGAFGFLTSGDGVIEANLGLKDMILALEWVQSNIKYFGGDPNLVTIFGESAGGAAVGLLLLSPLSKGLFKYAMSHSGSSLIPCAFQSKPRENFLLLASKLNCTAPTTEATLACMKSIEFPVLMEVLSETKWFVEFVHPMFPAVEYEIPRKSKRFLPDHPRELLRQGKFLHVPFIIGVVEDEGALQAGIAVDDTEFMEDLNERWNSTGTIAIGVDNRNLSANNLEKGLAKVRKFYFGDEDISLNNLQELANMFSDTWFVNSMDFTIRQHAKYAPVYPYLFTKKGALAISGSLVGKSFNRTVVSHGEELQYLFFKGLADSERDKIFAERFLKLWVSFAANGTPSQTWGTGKTWPPAEKDSWDYSVYILDDDTKVVSNPFKKRGQFWEEIYENEFKEHR